MRRKDWHGNRLRSPEEAKEMKKKRSRERYAKREKMINRFWLNNKILRELVHLFGVGTPISMANFDNRGFDSTICKKEEISNGQLYMCYDKYKIHITPEKNIVIWKI